MKYCTNKECEKVNPQSLSQFNKDVGRKDGLSSRCRSCRKIEKIEYYEKNKDVMLVKSAKYISENKEKVVAYRHAYYQEYKEELLVEMAIYYQENRDNKIAYQTDYYKENREEKLAYQSDYKRKNRGKVNALHAKRKAAKLLATPPWLTKEHFSQIEAFYIEAVRLTKETGILHHVDHIIPLQGKDVCGLHVPWNLQILTAAENTSKSNKYVLDN